MKKYVLLVILVIGTFPYTTLHAQIDQEINVEQSAEVFLEEYSDAFQENFFEGLKQKGIRNYDRAITYFLECKRLQPKNTVVAFELAKFHLYDKQLSTAQEYAVEAINGEPENYWYAETLVAIIDAQKSVIDNVADKIPWSHSLLRRNLAEVYFLKENYQSALKLLKGVKEPKKYAYLQERILDSIAKLDKIKNSKLPIVAAKQSKDLTSVEHFKNKLKELLMNDANTNELFEVSVEALDNFPSQPYFYYSNGVALNKRQQPNDAIEVLEAALDYLIDDRPLEYSIYRELAVAYKAIDNPSKANMYLGKIKPGF